MTVNERIKILIDKLNYNFSSFSRKTGINQSVISKTLNGRNKPSFDFIEKILKTFPLINAEWLILGKGDMFKEDVKEIAGMLVKTVKEQANNVNEAPADYRTKKDNKENEIKALKTIIKTQQMLIESLTEQVKLYKKILNE